MSKPKTIESVSEAVDMLLSDAFIDVWSDESDPAKLPKSRYPMGLWFRGQANAAWLLRPGVFRSGSYVDNTASYIDETSIFYHFKLRQPSYHKECQSTFDWLALMQHHGLPTRLLDWSESILVGLYFAVAGQDGAPGRLFALDARRLNQHCGFDMPEPELAVPEEFDSTLRAEMAVSNRFRKLLPRKTISDSAKQYLPIWKGHDFEGIVELIKNHDDDALRRLRSPVGVFPKRIQGRMIFQSSMFTLHGGKKIWSREGEAEEMLPTPIHLEDVQD